jgi:hypothetical protein
MTANTASDRLRYSKQYGSVLFSNDMNFHISGILQLPPNKRIHIMKSLSCLAKFTGYSNQWRELRQQYQLSWSTGTEKIDAFTRFFDSEKSLDMLLTWLKEALHVLPPKYSNLLLFSTLTGMRGSECVESVRLIKSVTTSNRYYNPERQILQHYLFPQLFIRRTKAIYISVVNDDIVRLCHNMVQTPTLQGLKKAIS